MREYVTAQPIFPMWILELSFVTTREDNEQGQNFFHDVTEKKDKTALL